MTPIQPICTAALLAYISWKLLSLARFYTHARRTGFPVLIAPFPTKNLLWMVLTPIPQPLLKRYTPEPLYTRLDVAIYGWECRQKAEVHAWLGKTFVLVTLDECTLWVADPTLSNVILQRRKDFMQPEIVGKVMGLFGPNVVTANCAEWQRQRKMVAPNLNEGISALVWAESCRQASQMSRYLLSNPGNKTLSGLRCVAINVLGFTGYGQRQRWTPDFESVEGETSQDGRGLYFETVSLVAGSLLEAALIPARVLRLPFMPARLRRLGRRKEGMPAYTKAVLDMERKQAGARDIQLTSTGQNSFLKALVKCADEAERGAASRLYLSDEEISGNLFIFSVAGFETTANTMGYAVLFLAAYPEWQDWIHEELDSLPADTLTWKYEEVFPKCKRILAVMYETLRLFTAVMHATRSITSPQTLPSTSTNTNTTHLLLPPMEIYISMQIMHADADLWGADHADFNPSRWLDSYENLITPPKGTFMPWSGGPRICPGMKMAQVEFVATIAVLFRRVAVEPVPHCAESAREARGRLLGVMEGPVAQVSLQVRAPEKVHLRWMRVGE
ncbi:cytochrome P450 [Aspergillus carlsbadensis]|nr:cytochrome P450 [Aspergillus carlsbadensis]